jgi:hypothetical protein
MGISSLFDITFYNMKTSSTPGFREAAGLLTEPMQQKYKNVKRNINKTNEAVLDIG